MSFSIEIPPSSKDTKKQCSSKTAFKTLLSLPWGLPRWHSVKNLPTNQCRRCGFNPWVRKIPCRRKRQPTLVLLPGESHGQRSLAGYNPWGHKESDTTEHMSTSSYKVNIKRRDEKIHDLNFSLGSTTYNLQFFICERDVKTTALPILQGCSKNQLRWSPMKKTKQNTTQPW